MELLHSFCLVGFSFPLPYLLPLVLLCNVIAKDVVYFHSGRSSDGYYW